VGGTGGVFTPEDYDRRLDGQRASGRHRVAGIDTEIQESQLKLAGIPSDAGQSRRQASLNADAAIEGFCHDPQHLPHDFANVQVLHPKGFLPRKLEELRGQFGPALG
jgi:hypothetical protein